MKHVPIALLIFVAPAFAEELPVNPAVTQATIGRTLPAFDEMRSRPKADA